MRGPNQVDSETGSAKRATREHQQCPLTSPKFGDQLSQENKKRNVAELQNEKKTEFSGIGKRKTEFSGVEKQKTEFS